MNKKKQAVSVVGHFGFGENLLNGQTIKTKIVTCELEKRFGASEVFKVDTHGGMSSYLKLPFQLFESLRKCRNVIILPAHRGIQVIAPILACFNAFFHRRLHYCVIGGWLPEMLKSKKRLSSCLKKFDAVYVETSTMKAALDHQGFDNIVILPNCKDLHILGESELTIPAGEPYKLCTFSRVMKEKGIEDAVEAVRSVNESAGRIVYTLDIYGQIDSTQTAWFEALKQTFPEYVRYGGLVPFQRSVEVLKDYFALLFPTHFYTEGIPGTIIDAYAAGIPVISSMWESFSDVIDDGITGIGYQFSDVNCLIALLRGISCTPEILNSKKLACIEKAKAFTPDQMWCVLGKRLDGNGYVDKKDENILFTI